VYRKIVKRIKLISVPVVTAIPLSTLMSCANVIEHKVSDFEGENLITPYSGFLVGWQLSVKNFENYHSSVWQHPTRGFNDAYVISVTLPDKEISYYRQVIDKPGYDSCVDFSTVTIQHSIAYTLLNESSDYNHYPRELWQTHCTKKDGSEAKILHLILQGQDSFYHMQKIWQDSFRTEEINAWQQHFKQTYLCDTRKPGMVCPNMPKAVSD